MRMRGWIIAAGALVAVSATGVGVLWAVQGSLLYAPDPADPGSAAALARPGVDVELHTTDGLQLRAWRFDPEPGTDPGPQRRVAVLYLPGNGGNRAGRVSVAQALMDRGITTLLLDYRGFGANPGTPSQDGLVADAAAGLGHLHEQGYAAQDIYLVGESLGTGVAVRLARDHDVAGMVLRSPYTSMAAVADRVVRIPVGWLLRDRYDTIATIGAVSAPVTVLAGGADDLVPASHSAAVAQRAPQLFRHVELAGVGHNDPIWFGDFLAEQVRDLARG